MNAKVARIIRTMVTYGLIAAISFSLGMAVSAPAHAESQFRYWSFWQSEGTQWSLANVGVGSMPVSQGAVQGWRFITSGVAAGAELAPRIQPNFAQLCSDSIDPQPGYVTMAIVIDYGTEADYDDGTVPPSPRFECVTITSDSTSAMALAQMSIIREDAGFICGLDKLPVAGCGEEVQVQPLTAGNSQSNPASSDTTTISEDQWDVIAAVVTTLLGLVVFVMAWRRMMLQKGLKAKARDDEH